MNWEHHILRTNVSVVLKKCFIHRNETSCKEKEFIIYDMFPINTRCEDVTTNMVRNRSIESNISLQRKAWIHVNPV